MFSFWTWSSIPNSGISNEIHSLDTQARKALTTKQNSSGLYPGLAIIHNQASKESRPHLLAMPRSLQVTIFRYVLCHTDELVVCVEDLELCQEPELLLVSKDVRAVALPIFYRETSFRCEPVAFDVLALQPWVRKRERAMQPAVNLLEVGLIDKQPFFSKPWQWRSSEVGVRAEYLIDLANERAAPPLPEPTTLFWQIDEKADWANLVEWLKLCHEGDIEGYEFGEERVQAKHRILRSVFAIVRVLRGQSWNTVLEVLKEAREALSAVDVGWSIERNDEEKMQEVSLSPEMFLCAGVGVTGDDERDSDESDPQTKSDQYE